MRAPLSSASIAEISTASVVRTSSCMVSSAAVLAQAAPVPVSTGRL
jgi:hypothetical protein